MTLNLRAVVLSDIGARRANNEDAAFAGRRLLAVADGMGGLPAGELASEIAIDSLRDLDDGVDPGVDLVEALRSRVERANARIRQAVAADPLRQGMGTTLTTLLVDGACGALLHIGDSRGYLWRGGRLTQLTPDHTYVQALVEQGVLSPEQAREHPQKALVTQALQGGSVAPYVADLDLLPRDRLLLCSDGLSDVVADADLAAALADEPGPMRCAQRLVDLALAGGGPDNITVVIADLVPA
ncbi:PP2C family protein-serine/threonine phosphatase [Pilimelia columellifera]|uniref:PPM-type phosphatase domain-containing protein n=1 Tax=Pilimelia columellifera subsp. columellifera TaxID=706583 RepID=A0ABN3NPI0_9ACTN